MIHQQEILENILSRVPATSIGRFRCVSKQWRALLLQPQFLKTHHNRMKHSPFPFAQQSLILVSYQSKSLFTTHLMNDHHIFHEMFVCANTNLSFGDNHQFFDGAVNVRRSASCEGLTLIEDDLCRLLLVNPTTKEFKLLPDSPYIYAPNPRSSFTIHAVGYDSTTDDYKVVSFSEIWGDEGNMCRVDVYSVKKGTWKKAITSPWNDTVENLDPGVFVDGHIHWLFRKISQDSYVIVAFHLGEENFREMPLPRICEGLRFEDTRLLTLGGCLSMFVSVYSQTHVWVMKEYGVKESWIEFTIKHTEKSMNFRPLCFLGDEQVVLVKDDETIDQKLVVYNFKEESFKDIVVQGITDKFGVRGTFMESLVSPHCSVK